MIFTVLKDHSSPIETRGRSRAVETTGRRPHLVWVRRCWLSGGECYGAGESRTQN